MARIIDFNALASYFEGDEDIMETLVASYLQCESDFTKALMVAIESREQQVVAKAVHRLRGTVSQFFAPSLDQVLNRLEIQAEETASDEGEEAKRKIQAVLAEVMSLLFDLREDLKQLQAEMATRRPR